jgi:hypothetical protein
MDRKGSVETTSNTTVVRRQTRPARASSRKNRKGARPFGRTKSESGALVCRYCGSDDLAPSFKKRRDARCRACFKSRYGSSARSNKAKKAGKAKAKK